MKLEPLNLLSNKHSLLFLISSAVLIRGWQLIRVLLTEPVNIIFQDSWGCQAQDQDVVQ